MTGIFAIAVIYVTIDLGIWILDRTGVTDVGYETIEEAMLNEKSIDVDEIVGVLTDDGFSLVICRDGGTYYTEIVKYIEGLYYFYDGRSKMIFWGARHEHFIDIRQIDNKNLVIIDSFPPRIDDVIISDSISSNFQFTEYTRPNGDGDRYWFLVLDELPDDYAIIIDDKEIPIVIN